MIVSEFVELCQEEPQTSASDALAEAVVKSLPRTESGDLDYMKIGALINESITRVASGKSIEAFTSKDVLPFLCNIGQAVKTAVTASGKLDSPFVKIGLSTLAQSSIPPKMLTFLMGIGAKNDW